jgi:NAD(P)-dependent dehydrogenase (short-subunit alcohol dehydrogenase family)
MNRLQNKIAVITGGNSGIGFATAEAFLAEGVNRVLITGRNAEAVQTAAAHLGERATGFVADVASLTDLKRLAEDVKAAVGTFDVLFVNAGVGAFAPVEAVDEAHFDYQFGINVKGAYFTIQSLLPLLNEGGSIVLNGSINAYIGMPNSSVYAASKAALHSFAKTLSAELVPRKIRVNVVSPGPTSTPLFGKLGLPAEALEGVAASIQRQVPLNRFADPTELARVVTFLASDDSSFMLGAEVIADGGMSTL